MLGSLTFSFACNVYPRKILVHAKLKPVTDSSSFCLLHFAGTGFFKDRSLGTVCRNIKAFQWYLLPKLSESKQIPNGDFIYLPLDHSNFVFADDKNHGRLQTFGPSVSSWDTDTIAPPVVVGTAVCT